MSLTRKLVFPDIEGPTHSPKQGKGGAWGKRDWRQRYSGIFTAPMSGMPGTERGARGILLRSFKTNGNQHVLVQTQPGRV